MKLLIVDDEELTRNGLISSIDWARLGISQIFQADDGINGLAAAKQHKPDIVLCDVRMPRMNGIEMLEQIESFLPNVSGIFMSGFSDKEYLKAAIKLKAISYIEKPIDLAEVCEAIASAAKLQQSAADTTGIFNYLTNLEHLAYCLTVPYPSVQDTLADIFDKTKDIKPAHFKYCFTMIFRLEAKDNQSPDLSSFYGSLIAYLATMHLSMIYSEKRQNHLVLHIYGGLKPTLSTIELISQKAAELMTPICRFYLTVGDVAEGISNVYNSYTSAVITLQKAFFYPAESILFASSSQEKYADTLTAEKIVNNYIEAVKEGQAATCSQCLDELKDLLTCSSGILVNQLKSLYFEMYSALNKLNKKRQISADSSLENIFDIMDLCFSFDDLHSRLSDINSKYLKDSPAASSENSLIQMIKDYIRVHYMESDLSVKAISLYVAMSASYTCTFFKNETGTTLNQYITEYRMKKAKSLLADPRNTVGEISSQVGYSDSNYFGKSFRKYTGLSPSEYREQVVKDEN